VLTRRPLLRLSLPQEARLVSLVERHHKTATILTSNRDPSEWIGLMSEPLLAQSAVDRLVATSYELVIEGESYRRRQRPQHTATSGASD
jgi:DNA replication protein DnaC